MIHGFTNLREYAGQADRVFLTDGQSTISIEKAPCFDAGGPKELDKILYSKDNTNNLNVKNSLLYHHDVTNGSLSIPSLSINSASTHGIDGIYFNSNFEIKNLKIGSQKNPKNIHHKGGSISFGNANKPITDSGGLVDNATIILKYNGSAGVSFPDWDRYLEIDDILENAEKPCLRNKHNLETVEACDDCDDRSDLWYNYEYKRRERCLNHPDGGGGGWNINTQKCANRSNCARAEFLLAFFLKNGNLNLANVTFGGDCSPPTNREAIQYIKCWLEQTHPSLQGGHLRISGETLTCKNLNSSGQYNHCELFNNLGDLYAGNDGWRILKTPYDMDSSCYNGSQSPCPPTSPPETHYVGFTCYDESNIPIECPPFKFPLGQGKFIYERSECYNVLNPEDAKSDCLNSCKSGNNFEVDPYAHWRLTKNGMACENLYGARVDITEYCGCGGLTEYDNYKSDGSYSAEDMSCGWRALMNE